MTCEQNKRRYIWKTEEVGNIIFPLNYYLWDRKNYGFLQWGKKKPERTQNAFRYLSVETLIKGMKRGRCETFSIESPEPTLSKVCLKWTSQVVHRVFSFINSQHLILGSYMGTSFYSEIWALFYLSLQGGTSRMWLDYSNFRGHIVNSNLKKLLNGNILIKYSKKFAQILVHRILHIWMPGFLKFQLF